MLPLGGRTLSILNTLQYNFIGWQISLKKNIFFFGNFVFEKKIEIFFDFFFDFFL